MGRGLNFLIATASATMLCTALNAQDTPAEPIHPQAHVAGWPDALEWNPMQGPEMQRGRSARAMLAERRRLDAALEQLQPQRAGTVDAYVVAVALDSDPVFAREAREAGNVLSRRYDAEGRTLVLAGPDGRSGGLPRGSISSLTVALARIAEILDPAEDVLVLYSTSHGMPQGLAYHEGDSGYGVLSPAYLGTVLGELGLDRRLLLLSACYSGIFVPYLATYDTAIATASAADRTSFGCRADNDWTYFGDAVVNNALRKPQGLAVALEEARSSISEWEARAGLMPSLPQVQIGEGARQWLRYLESRMPATTSEPVGRPAAGG